MTCCLSERRRIQFYLDSALAPLMFKPGDSLGPYTLVSKLGRGAFGVVWLAEKRSALLTPRVAIKLPNDEDINLEEIRREASVWEQAGGHPNILPILDADIYDGQVLIVSEYAPDGSLTNWLSRSGGKAPSIADAINMTIGILKGLEHLHSKNIIHRDLKPDNILLQGEIPRLADFGIARILKDTSSYSTLISGTPKYMAPEAYRGKRSEQTDIWSVGVIFYQLLSGSLPYSQSDAPSLMYAVCNDEPRPLPSTVPNTLKLIVSKALRKESDERYKAALEMRNALIDFISNGSGAAGSQTPDARPEVPMQGRDAGSTNAREEQEETIVAKTRHPSGALLARGPRARSEGSTKTRHEKHSGKPKENASIFHGSELFSATERAELEEFLKGRLINNEKLTVLQLQARYWTNLNDYLRKSNSPVRLISPRTGNAVTGYLGHPETYLVATVNTVAGEIRAGVRICNRDILNTLNYQKEKIEREIRQNRSSKVALKWFAQRGYKTVYELWLNKSDANIRRRQHWQEYIAWHQKNLEFLYKVFEPRMKRYKPLVPTLTKEEQVQRFWEDFDKAVSEKLPQLTLDRVAGDSSTKSWRRKAIANGVFLMAQLDAPRNSLDVSITMGSLFGGIFSQLSSQRDKIAKELGPDFRRALRWEVQRYGERTIFVRHNVSLGEPETWDSTLQLVVESLEAFSRVFPGKVN